MRQLHWFPTQKDGTPFQYVRYTYYPAATAAITLSTASWQSISTSTFVITIR